jgi:alpha-galactosidase
LALARAELLSSWINLRRGGISLILDVAGPQLPRVVHWGGDLGDLSDDQIAALPGALFVHWSQQTERSPIPVTVSPERAQSWSGWPGLSGHRAGLASQPLFAFDGDATVEELADRVTVTYRGSDAAAALQLTGEIELTDSGVIRTRQTLRSVASPGDAPYEVADLLTWLPVPDHVVELMDFTGRWSNEAQPQRIPLRQGGWLREQRRGRTGPDSPLLLMAGTAGFDHRRGDVWGVHLGWSGDQRYLAQRLNSGVTLLSAGEILEAGEVILQTGEEISTPWMYAAHSCDGIDGLSKRLHAYLRARPSHPRRERPIVLNTWEAVYFEMSFDRLSALAEVASEIGVERFVIDDGWFGSRRNDKSGLGDWTVSGDVWPAGLVPIANRVRELGMEFGLWFEPEMVNLDSELAREHPDWVLGTPGRMPPPWRSQQVLDVAHPDAFDYLIERISTLVEECGIAYIKWDHNRDLADPVHRGGPRAGRPAVREQTLATYRLMDELRIRHPSLEIESCSSGGSRIDYGILERTDRVWASDCIDPIERLRIVPGIATLLPLELIGAHVASGRSHTTGRQHDLALRMAVALFGHTGFEWDLTTTSAVERLELAKFVELAKSLRSVLHAGQFIQLDRPDGGTTAFGVVDAGQAVFLLARTATDVREGAAALRLAGLEPDVDYLVDRVSVTGEPDQRIGVVSGRQLMAVGIAAPGLAPDQAAIFRLRAP